MTARSGPRRDRSRGQALVEFSVLVPAFMLILFGMLEFGFVFTHNLTLEYATREGARTGAALADGGGNAAICATIDPQIIAAVERVLTSPGSPIDETHVTTIQIWKATAAGVPTGGAQTSTWNYGTGGAPTVDGFQLHYHETLELDLDALHPQQRGQPGLDRGQPHLQLQHGHPAVLGRPLLRRRGQHRGHPDERPHDHGPQPMTTRSSALPSSTFPTPRRAPTGTRPGGQQ